MKNNTLKWLLWFWQEISLILLTSILLLNISRYVLINHSLDAWDIAALAYAVPVFIGLIGQFFWKNKILSNILFVLLFVGSVLIILTAFMLFGISTSNLIDATLMLVLGIFCFVAALSMYTKTSSLSQKRNTMVKA